MHVKCANYMYKTNWANIKWKWYEVGYQRMHWKIKKTWCTTKHSLTLFVIPSHSILPHLTVYRPDSLCIALTHSILPWLTQYHSHLLHSSSSSYTETSWISKYHTNILQACNSKIYNSNESHFSGYAFNKINCYYHSYIIGQPLGILGIPFSSNSKPGAWKIRYEISLELSYTPANAINSLRAYSLG
jgi:hypothetical protein